MILKFADVVEVKNNKVRVKFPEDAAASGNFYLKLKSYIPTVGDRVFMIRTGNTFVCMGVVDK